MSENTPLDVISYATLHLLSSRCNAERLQKALEDAAAGRLIEFDPLACRCHY